ncbi:diphthamide synthesis protein [Vararia minispora EC-137]|uniref:Diphthamide synthesis protein n=1 Tax=Vararia minispora EC-137 TaxID=1314806 RepID=A0ACB8QPD0_9AGAM|nr:diphthamide synthesis protein [Vararia minispora EC-137]
MDPVPSSSQAPEPSTKKAKKRFIGSKTVKSLKSRAAVPIANQIPQDILDDLLLNAAIKQLPSNYSFEIHKTIHHIRNNGATMVALQMPEGLQMFGCTIADIIERFTDALTLIMGDVTYGACCIDDYTAVALGCDMLIHYGHSCLVPMDQTMIKTLYVFVEIAVDSRHLAQTIRLNFPDDRSLFHESLLDGQVSNADTPAGTIIGRPNHLRIEGPSKTQDEANDDSSCVIVQPSPARTRLALVSTIQFVAALQQLKEDLSVEYGEEKLTVTPVTDDPLPKLWTGVYEATIPRSKPLSPGELLGCTAPPVGDVDALIYLGDGRFHLESVMIENPHIPAFRYDPYSKKLTREYYGHREMCDIRNNAVQVARKSIDSFTTASLKDVTPPLWGVVLGTLGRQGSFKQLQACSTLLQASRTAIPYMPILLSELSPAKLALFNPHVAVFVQTSCPRLSIDWGYAFERPLLTPYETSVAVGKAVGWTNGRDEGMRYPMDFYSAGSPWAISRMKGEY